MLYTPFQYYNRCFVNVGFLVCFQWDAVPVRLGQAKADSKGTSEELVGELHGAARKGSISYGA